MILSWPPDLLVSCDCCGRCRSKYNRRRMRVAFAALIVLTAGAAYGQPVRVPIRLPIAASALADALQLASARPSTILLDTIRLVYTSPDAQAGQRAAAALARAIDGSAAPGETAPLPLDPNVWRSAIL